MDSLSDSNNIFIVEDDLLIAKKIAVELGALGYNVVGICESAEDALKQIKEIQPDLVLMDIMLAGGMDGIVAAQYIRDHFNIPCVYLTSYSDDNFLKRAMITEPFGYILKPYSSRELHAAISIALYKIKIEKELTAALWISEAFSSISDGIIVLELDGRVNLINLAAEKIIDKVTEQVVDKKWNEILQFHGETDDQKLLNAIDKVIAEGKSVHLRGSEISVTDARNILNINISVTPIFNSGENIRGVTLVIHDNTERKQFEQKLVDYQEHLQDMVNEQTHDLIETRDEALVAERSMSAFLANMSHELRTPLHGILSYSKFGITKIADATKDKLLTYFTEINESGQLLLNLINDLLDLSKLRAGKMVYDFKATRLDKLVKKVVAEFFELVSENGRSLNLELDDNKILVKVDSEKIAQVIRNLLSNAIKFSTSGTTITVSVSYIEGSIVRINVTDFGIGLPDNELDDIFNPFTQSSNTKNKAGGTGLGLAICKEIVEQGHAGSICAQNNPDKSTSFIITIPCNN